MRSFGALDRYWMIQEAGRDDEMEKKVTVFLQYSV